MVMPASQFVASIISLVHWLPWLCMQVRCCLHCGCHRYHGCWILLLCVIIAWAKLWRAMQKEFVASLS